MSNLPVPDLKKQFDILNSEGSILGLYFDSKKHDLYLSSFLTGTSGNVFYRTTAELLRRFIRSELTINQLFHKSPDIIVTRVSGNLRERLLKDHFSFSFFGGDKQYRDFNSDCKSKEFEKDFG